MRYIREYVRHVLAEMSTRHKRETGENLPRWQDKLVDYASRGGHFVHFSRFPKMGLYPLNDFNTPTGFYAYPLEEGKIASFATDRPYAIVFKPKDSARLLNLDDYTDSDLSADVQRLVSEQGLTKSLYQKGIADARDRTPGGALWNITRLMSKIGMREKTSRKNPAWTRAKAKHYDDMWWIVKKIYFGNPDDATRKRKRDDLVKEFLAYSNDKKLHYMTRKKWRKLYHMTQGVPLDIPPHELEIKMTQLGKFQVNPQANKWASILRNLGYDGVVDEGKRIIHVSEPFQAVFFSVSSLELIDIVDKSGLKTTRSNILKPGASDSTGTDTNFDMEFVSDKEFTDSIAGQDFSHQTIEKAMFTNIDAMHTNFKGSIIEDCIFEEVDMSGANLDGCVMHVQQNNNNEFLRCVFNNTSVVNASLTRVNFYETTIEETNFSYTKFKGCSFSGCELSDVNFSDAQFNKVSFTVSAMNCIMDNSYFTEVTIHGAIRDCKFRDAKFVSCLIRTDNNDLSTIDLKNADVSGLRVLPTSTIMPKGYKITDSTGKVEKIA
jgi:fluoroquinolone resistance protein